MADLLIGTSAYPSADRGLLREAGIGWLRQSFPFPFRDRVGGELTEEYVERRERVRELAAEGFRILGVTPLPGIATRERDEEGRLEWRRWNPRVPDWCGPPGTERFARTYGETCAWLADDLHGQVPVWQVANELDIPPFAWEMNPRQSCDLIVAGARGLKDADGSLTVGFNLTAGRGKTYYFLGYFYGRTDGLLDYCGLDGYYGTWQPGGPESWAERIAEVHALTGRPLLINEWGFSSAGGVMSGEEAEQRLSTCQTHRWRNSWGPGHNPEGQAAFVRQAFDVFAEHRDQLLGLSFYRWEDQDECWQCGEAGCPAETAWGLVDRDGRPKPAFHAFKEGAARLAKR